MREGLIIKANWLLYKKYILRHMTLLGVSNPKETYRKAKKRYMSEMIRLPEYGEYDVLKLNLSHAVMLGAIYQSCEEEPTVDQLTEFYCLVVLSPKIVRSAFSRMNMVSPKRIRRETAQGEKSQFATHPFTWQYCVENIGEDRFTALFSRCGIYDYLSSIGLEHIVPAMCALDYTFGECGNHYFLRKETIATGGKVCDCTYIGRKAATNAEIEECEKDKKEEALRGGRHIAVAAKKFEEK